MREKFYKLGRPGKFVNFDLFLTKSKKISGNSLWPKSDEFYIKGGGFVCN